MDHDTPPEHSAAPKPADYELAVLTEIGQVLASTSDLRRAVTQVMEILASKMDMQRAALVMLDEATGRLRTVIAPVLSEEQMRRNDIAVGQGITGKVVATGRTMVVPDIRSEPAYLNLMGRIDAEPPNRQLCLFAVPIRVEGRVGGALVVDKHYLSQPQIYNDQIFLEIVSTFLSQAIQINSMVLREKQELLEENAQLRAQVRDRYRFENIIGDSPAMHDVFAMVGQVADSRATILLVGESGTGKEMFAKAIHYNSPRRNKSFIRVNCGALTSTLLESELFGHVKGSFTGAIKDRAGRFEAANGGTLFLDEIGTMELPLQVKLLRVLQEREFERVGDTSVVKVDVRIIAATNADLEAEIARGTFREDLFYRLNVINIKVPSLRDRRQDIPPLIDHFLDKYNTMNQRRLHRLSRETLNLLMRYPWPGNVRELENAIERAVVLSRDENFTEDLLPLSVKMFAQQQRGSGAGESIAAITTRLAEQAVSEYQSQAGEIHQLVIDQIEKALIENALKHCGGVKTRAADFLGINRNTLNKKVKDLGIESASEPVV